MDGGTGFGNHGADIHHGRAVYHPGTETSYGVNAKIKRLWIVCDTLRGFPESISGAWGRNSRLLDVYSTRYQNLCNRSRAINCEISKK